MRRFASAWNVTFRPECRCDSSLFFATAHTSTRGESVRVFSFAVIAGYFSAGRVSSAGNAGSSEARYRLRGWSDNAQVKAQTGLTSHQRLPSFYALRGAKGGRKKALNSTPLRCWGYFRHRRQPETFFSVALGIRGFFRIFAFTPFCSLNRDICHKGAPCRVTT